jgi:pimeloyl-ACP methyl ester carboxylesterase
MKNTLAKRVLLRLYSAKFNIIGLFSPKRAAYLAFKFFSTPIKTGSKKKIPTTFQKAIRVSLKVDGNTVRGFHWRNPDPKAKKILIVHGFSSNVFKFEQYVLALKKEEFEVLAFDAPGHGISDGKEINALIYRDTILAIEKEFGTLYGIVSHSLGGLAASLALEQFDTPENRKLVLIAPATETTTTLVGFYEMVPLSLTVKKAFEDHIQLLADEPVSFYSVARIAKKSLVPTLWLHDEEDYICPISDVTPVLAEHLPLVTFHITKGLGHNYIYKNTDTIDRVVKFLNSRK